MYVCMYVCMYLCMYVCMYVCNVCMYVCMYCMYVCMHSCMQASRSKLQGRWWLKPDSEGRLTQLHLQHRSDGLEPCECLCEC